MGKQMSAGGWRKANDDRRRANEDRQKVAEVNCENQAQKLALPCSHRSISTMNSEDEG